VDQAALLGAIERINSLGLQLTGLRLVTGVPLLLEPG
jgi:hypothetical protein